MGAEGQKRASQVRPQTLGRLGGGCNGGGAGASPPGMKPVGGESRGPNFKSDKSQAEMFTIRKIGTLINQVERQLNYGAGNEGRDHQY